MYLYGERNLKEKLKILIFDIQEVNCTDKSAFDCIRVPYKKVRICFQTDFSPG